MLQKSISSFSLVLKRSIQRSLGRYGYTVKKKYPTLDDLRVTLLNSLKVNLVVDVGANEGQFVRKVRNSGWLGTILSVEPQSLAFNKLVQNHFSNNVCFNGALGSSSEQRVLHISKNSVSSSFFNVSRDVSMQDSQLESVSEEVVNIVSLSSLISDHGFNDATIHAKIDVQGFEIQVLEGALDSIDNIVSFEVETSLSGCYDSDSSILNALSYLDKYGYIPIWCEPGYISPKDGFMREVDLFFIKSDLAIPPRPTNE